MSEKSELEDPLEKLEDPLEKLEDPLEKLEDPLEKLEDPLEKLEDPLEEYDLSPENRPMIADDTTPGGKRPVCNVTEFEKALAEETIADVTKELQANPDYAWEIACALNDTRLYYQQPVLPPRSGRVYIPDTYLNRVWAACHQRCDTDWRDDRNDALEGISIEVEWETSGDAREETMGREKEPPELNEEMTARSRLKRSMRDFEDPMVTDAEETIADVTMELRRTPDVAGAVVCALNDARLEENFWRNVAGADPIVIPDTRLNRIWATHHRAGDAFWRMNKKYLGEYSAPCEWDQEGE